MIDAHHHILDHTRYDYEWIPSNAQTLQRDYLPDDLKPALDEAGVTHTVLVQTFSSLAESEWFLDLAEAHDFIAGVVGWVDLTAADVGAQVDRLRARGDRLVGIRHGVQGEPDDDWLARDDVRAGLRALAEKGLTYDLLVTPRHLKHVPALAQALPGLKLVIDHIAKPPIHTGAFDGWREALAQAAAHENVYCKLSGMITEADHANWRPVHLRPYVEHVVECFGFERLMFGSDWPVCLMAGSYAQVLDALERALGPIDDEAARQLYHETAARFYGLDV